MNDSHIISIAQIEEFIKVDQAIKFKAISKKEKYLWIDNVLTKFGYLGLRKKDKGVIREYIVKMTGLSPSQVDRVIARKRKFGRVFLNTTKKHKFPRKYQPSDIALLIRTDNAHERLSGQATKRILFREYNEFTQIEYQRIAEISVAHIYNLRATRQYRSQSLTINKTQSRQVAIGKREKPSPKGIPGYLRVDTVHQGDYEKQKGLYHINLTDEVLQWEIIGAVGKISEWFKNLWGMLM